VLAIRRALEPFRLTSEGELLEELAKRIVQEGLHVVSCADTYLTSIQGTLTESSAAASSAATTAAATQAAQTTPLQDEEAAQEQRTQAAATEETHYIEVELLDENGQPVPNEAYFVELPDGTTKSGRTDANGYARVDGVEPGTAKISFPDLDKDSTTQG
jgi:hypothetical protein